MKKVNRVLLVVAVVVFGLLFLIAIFGPSSGSSSKPVGPACSSSWFASQGNPDYTQQDLADCIDNQ